MPLFTYKSASPVPPLIVNVSESCPAGTSNFQYCCEADAPEMPVTGTPFVNGAVTGGAVTVNVNVARCVTDPTPVIVIG